MASGPINIARPNLSRLILAQPAGQPFEGDAESALAFAEKVRRYKNRRRVEAWTEAVIELPPAIQAQFRIERHENGRDWIVVESYLTHRFGRVPCSMRWTISAFVRLAFVTRSVSKERRLS